MNQINFIHAKEKTIDSVNLWKCKAYIWNWWRPSSLANRGQTRSRHSAVLDVTLQNILVCIRFTNFWPPLIWRKNLELRGEIVTKFVLIFVSKLTGTNCCCVTQPLQIELIIMIFDHICVDSMDFFFRLMFYVRIFEHKSLVCVSNIYIKFCFSKGNKISNRIQNNAVRSLL